MTSTRSKTKVNLLDTTYEKCLGDLHQLPSIKDALQRLHFFMKVKKYDLATSSTLVVEETFKVWQRASIPTIEKRNAI